MPERCVDYYAYNIEVNEFLCDLKSGEVSMEEDAGKQPEHINFI